MKLTPVTGPGAIPPNGTPEHVRTAKAVEAFNKGASSYDRPSNHAPQLDQNALAPEDMSAIIAPTEQEDDKSAELSATSEETAVEVQEKPKEDPALSRQFAQLARQEKALRAKAQQQDQQFRAREEAIKAKEAELSSKGQQYSTGYIDRQQLKADPLTALADAGVTYEELTQQILNQQPKDPRVEATISRLEAKIKALEEASEGSKKTYAEQQETSYKAAVRQIEFDAKSLVKADPIAYEAIVKTGSVKDVVELITSTYEKDGVVLSVEEAAQEVENYLVEENYKISSRIEKIKKRLTANAQSQQAPKKQIPSPQTQPQMKTLTNAASSARRLSAKERAILAFKGELKN